MAVNPAARMRSRMRSATASAVSRVGLHQQHDELLAAVARGDVDVAHRLLDDVRDLAQHGVAGAVAVGVVVALEVVEVAEEHAERPLQLARAVQLLAQALVQVAVVVEAGERVGDGVDLGAAEADGRRLQHRRRRSGARRRAAPRSRARESAGRSAATAATMLPGGVADRRQARDPHAELVGEHGVDLRALAGRAPAAARRRRRSRRRGATSRSRPPRGPRR